LFSIAEIRFEDIHYAGQPLRAGNVQTEVLNGYRLTELFSKLIFLDKDYSFAIVTIEQLKTNRKFDLSFMYFTGYMSIKKYCFTEI